MVKIGAQFIIIATTVSLKYLTAIKLTKIATFPVTTLTTNAGSSFIVIVSNTTRLMCQFKYSANNTILMRDR